jgi:hypothetical protein
MLGLLKRRREVPSNYMDALSPLSGLISSWLACARAQNATAIVIGMPRQVPASVGDKDCVEFRQQLMSGPPLPDADAVNGKATHALMESSRLKSVVGWRSVPVWMEHAGQLYPTPGPPIDLHLALLSSIQERLVSLNASEDSPKPMRHIEYDSIDPAYRCFAEVELNLLEDNTVRIEIVQYLRMPRSVRAVESVY